MTWKAREPVAAGDMQDGVLAYYLGQARAADINVEARLEREPFDFRDMVDQWDWFMKISPGIGVSADPRKHSITPRSGKPSRRS